MAETVPNISDAKLYTDLLPGDRDSSEDAGFIITARTADHDIYLYACAYVIRAGGKGIWLIPDGRINGTIFFAIPRAMTGKGLTDNAFVRTGWHFNQYLKPQDHKVVNDAGRAVWSMGGRNYIWRDGAWEVSGAHGGVQTNLTFRPCAPAEWRWGPFDKLMEADSAGYKVAALVSGTITVGEETFVLEDGYATAERAVVGQSRDIVAELVGGHQVLAFEIRGPGLEIQVHRHTGRKMEAGNVVLNGERIDFGPWIAGSSVEIETLDYWDDPHSGLHTPCRWRIVLASADGSAEIEVGSSGRSYFHYNTDGGVMLMMQILGVANGVFRSKDGATTPIVDALVGLRWGRALLFANETLTGSVV